MRGTPRRPASHWSAFAANVTAPPRSSTSSTIGRRPVTWIFGMRIANGIAIRCTTAAPTSTRLCRSQGQRSSTRARRPDRRRARWRAERRAFSATRRSSSPTSHGTSELFAIDDALLSTSTMNASGKNARLFSSTAISSHRDRSTEVRRRDQSRAGCRGTGRSPCRRTGRRWRTGARVSRRYSRIVGLRRVGRHVEEERTRRETP